MPKTSARLRSNRLSVCLVFSALCLFGSESSHFTAATPESQGVDSRLLEECLRYIRSKQLRIHSLLVVRHGRMILNAYFYPFQEAQLHDFASVTKSVTSAVIGVAIDKGRIKTVRQPVLQLLANLAAPHTDPRKKLITVEDLLTMRSGLDCGFHTGEVELAKMQMSTDWAKFTLDLPMHGNPGRQFAYCSCNPFLLSAILSEQTGESELEFARQHLFSPLGISEVVWPSDSKGRNHGWGDLHLFPEDMAKLGVLFLNYGRWHGDTLISSSWVKKSLSTQVQARPGMGYGYSWWINQNLHPAGFEAAGRGGQQIAILPAHDAVIVFTGGGFDAGKISDFLLRSMASSRAIPENPESLSRLKDQLRVASQEPSRPKSREKALPAIARYASERKYVFPANEIQFRSVRIQFRSPDQAHAELDLAGNILEFDIGLDGRPRSSPGQYGLPVLAEGRWLSADTFSLDLDTVANINHFFLQLTFADNGVAVRLDEVTGEVSGFSISGKSS